MTVRACIPALAAVLAGCAGTPERLPAPAEWVVLLPGAEGATGAVTVRESVERQAGAAAEGKILDSPYASAGQDIAGGIAVGRSEPAAVREYFAEALGALPMLPAQFIVHFVFGQDELTEESRKNVAPVLKDFARRPAPEITVTGHTDQVGADRVNDELSLRRAERVKDMLVQAGVPAERIVAAGRGSREPLVRVPEGVAEPLNRRVEISVR